jgi:hypothetical protein
MLRRNPPRTRKEEWNPDELLKRRAVVIRREDLNPLLQYGALVTRKGRRVRGLIEVLTPLYFMTRNPLTSALGAPNILMRTIVVRTIQRLHETHKEIMNKVGVLSTATEGNYPRDWMNPTSIARTHPIFYVNARGDFVFLRETRSEYYRYRYQNTFFGKWSGTNLWKWRAYLEPPHPPKAWKEWANDKLKKMREARENRQLEPYGRPALRPVPVPMQKRRSIRRLRRA